MIPGKKDAQTSALDSLMAGGDSGEPALPAAPAETPEAAPKEDPSALLEKIRGDVEKLSALISSMG
jgi:hypothetical protein